MLFFFSFIWEIIIIIVWIFDVILVENKIVVILDLDDVVINFLKNILKVLNNMIDFVGDYVWVINEWVFIVL